MRTALLVLALTLATAAPAAAAPALSTVGNFDRPLYVTSPPKDSRIFVVEKGGKIKIVGRGTFLDATSLTDGSFEERGLLSVAFPPDYASSGLFYVFLTDRDTGDLKVYQFRRSANPDRADPIPVKTILSIPHGPEYHNGGQLQFGPDGMLYVSTGDGHDSSNAQDTSSLLGKILRLVPTTGAAAPGNPHGRVWAYGLRNPWRFSFDRGTGDIAIADVGASTWEEIDWGAAPTRARDYNFGWPDCEGPSGSCPVGPIIWHNHSEGFCAIVGGYVVRDPRLPTLKGRYIYSDNCKGSTYSAAPRTGAGDRKEASALDVPAISSFGEDACGRVYATSLAGPVYRIHDGTATPCTFGGGGGGGDRTAPFVKVSLRGMKTAIKKRRLLVRVRSSEASLASVGTRLIKVKRLKTRYRGLPAGQRVTVRVKLTKKVAKALRRRVNRKGFVRVAVTVRATDAAGNTRVVRRHGRIKK
jgi:hypothetical protein